MKDIELVAPAGSFLSLILAVQQGANAVYIGYNKYSARAYADNFNMNELKYAISYAHLFDVKVYLALNTLYYESEIKDVLEIAKLAYLDGIDAIIIQDIGILNIFINSLPNLPIHASTQMTCHSLNHILFLKELGIKRVVVSRENSFNELEFMSNGNLPLEMFIHGSMCICYSGQCYFSYFIGKRSGNRGCCAQPCRKKYNLVIDNKFLFFDDFKYLLSPKDLNLSNFIPTILKSNIKALKIEGRMKRPEYVSGIVMVYNNIICYYKNNKKYIHFDKLKKNLERLYNRNFTTGYFIEQKKEKIVNLDIPYNRGFLIGNVVCINNQFVNILLRENISSKDGISIGNLDSQGKNNNDPRFGFYVQRMYVENNLYNECYKGQIVSIELPKNFLFNIKNIQKNDPVYKTYDYKFNKKLLNNIINIPNDKIQSLISNNFENFINFINIIGSKEKKIDITIYINICKYKKIEMEVVHGDYKFVMFSDYVVESAITSFTSEKQVYDIINKKTNNFIYNIISIDIKLEKECFIPVKILKNLRNDILNLLLFKKIENYKVPRKICLKKIDSEINNIYKNIKLNNKNISIIQKKNKLISIVVYTIEQLSFALKSNIDIIYFGGEIFQLPFTNLTYGITIEELRIFINNNNIIENDLNKLYFKTPTITKDKEYEKLDKIIKELLNIGIKGVLISNVGTLYFLKQKPYFKYLLICIDNSLNITNSYSFLFYNSFINNIISISLSNELNFDNIHDILDNLKEKNIPLPLVETFVYGYPKVMISEYIMELNEKEFINKVGKSHNINHFNIHFFQLEDLNEKRYPLLYNIDIETKKYSRTYILNYRKVDLLTSIEKLIKYDYFSYVFRIDGIGIEIDELKNAVICIKK